MSHEDFLLGVPCALRLKQTGLCPFSPIISRGALGYSALCQVRVEARPGAGVWGRRGEHEKLENGFLLPLKSLKFRESIWMILKALFQQKSNKVSTSWSILNGAGARVGVGRSNGDVVGRHRDDTGMSKRTF